jgi:hypothetical protein
MMLHFEPREVRICDDAAAPVCSRRQTAAFGRIEGRSLALGAGVVALMLAVSAPVRAQFSATPVIVQLTPAADSAATTIVQVRNEGKQDQQFRFYTGDFDQDAAGEHQFFASGKHERSCAARMTVFPDGATLHGGESQSIRVRMTSGDRTCWSVLFVESMPPVERGVRASQRIAVKVYGVRAGLAPAGDVTDVAATVASALPGASAADTTRAAAPLQVEVEFSNTADAPLRPFGRVEVRTFDGKVVTKEDVEPFSVLPGHKRRILVPINTTLPRGEYLAVPVLEFGADFLAGGQAAFEIK